jgi:hypothetical protein
MMGSANKMIGGRKRVSFILISHCLPPLTHTSHSTIVCASCSREGPQAVQ